MISAIQGRHQQRQILQDIKTKAMEYASAPNIAEGAKYMTMWVNLTQLP